MPDKHPTLREIEAYLERSLQDFDPPVMILALAKAIHAHGKTIPGGVRSNTWEDCAKQLRDMEMGLGEFS